MPNVTVEKMPPQLIIRDARKKAGAKAAFGKATEWL